MISRKIKTISQYLLSFYFVLLFILPTFALAQGVVPPTTNSGHDTPAKGNVVYVCMGGAPGECTFGDLIAAVKQIVNWATVFAISFSVVVIAYAGSKYMISGDNAGERKKANQMLIKVVLGFVYILLAWVIVNLVLSGLQVTVPTFLK